MLNLGQVRIIVGPCRVRAPRISQLIFNNPRSSILPGCAFDPKFNREAFFPNSDN